MKKIYLVRYYDAMPYSEFEGILCACATKEQAENIANQIEEEEDKAREEYDSEYWGFHYTVDEVDFHEE